MKSYIKKISKFFLKNKVLSLFLIIILTSLVISLIGFLAFENNYHLVLGEKIKNELARLHILSEGEQSTADLYISDSQLKINFNVAEDEKEKVNLALNKLEIDPKVLEGVGFKLNEESIKKIEEVLPAKLYVNFLADGISFNTLNKPLLSSSITKDHIEYATEGGKLDLKVKGENSFELMIEEPEVLVVEASKSGKLNLSERLDRVVPTLAKIGTIELKVNGKNISGEIKFK